MHQLLGSLGFRYLPNEFDLGFTMIETKLGSTIDFYAFKDFWLRFGHSSSGSAVSKHVEIDLGLRAEPLRQ
eukprot:432484-Rhodomonas_salina.1